MVNSLYELTRPSTEIAKSRFLDNFCGDGTLDLWAIRQVSGSGGSGAIQDGLDNGYKVNTSTSSSAFGLYLVNKNHFSTGCGIVSIFQSQRLNSCDNSMRGGLAVNAGINEYIFAEMTNICCAGVLLVSEESCNVGSVSAGICADTSWHGYKVKVVDSEFGLLWVDGILQATQSCTSTLPNSPLQPLWYIDNKASGTDAQGRLRYFEAYNI